METIRQFIESLFKEEKYTNIESDSSFSICSNSENNDFWIIVENFNYEEQDKLFDGYKKIMDEKNTMPYEKNTSVLCIKQFQSDDDLEKAVVIENDPFYFKKYVLLYSIEDWNRLCLLGLSNIKQLIMNADVFKKFKENEQFHYYELLYKIAHKLPFLRIERNNVDDFMDINALSAESEEEKSLEEWIISLPYEDMETSIDEKLRSEITND